MALAAPARRGNQRRFCCERNVFLGRLGRQKKGPPTWTPRLDCPHRLPGQGDAGPAPALVSQVMISVLAATWSRVSNAAGSSHAARRECGCGRRRGYRGCRACSPPSRQQPIPPIRDKDSGGTSPPSRKACQIQMNEAPTSATGRRICPVAPPRRSIVDLRLTSRPVKAGRLAVSARGGHQQCNYPRGTGRHNRPGYAGTGRPRRAANAGGTI